MKKAVKLNAHIAEQNSPLRDSANFVLNADTKRNIVIWRFSDGRAGHDSQSNGIIEALKDRVDCECHEVSVPFSFSSYCYGLLKIFPAVSHLPDPDLLVGAGHACHFPMLLTRHIRGGQALVLMKPSLPTRLFDLCLIPGHDSFKAGPNIISTEGPLNTLRPSSGLSMDHGLILIGGESKHFHWEEQKLLKQLLQILNSKDLNWTITDSPRTSLATRNILQTLHKDKVTYIPFTGKQDTTLPNLLHKSGIIWVSEDSMSMIYEALSTGASVGVLRIPAKAQSRLADVAQSLAKKQLLTIFDDWLLNKSLSPPINILTESARCADILIERYGWSRKKSV